MKLDIRLPMGVMFVILGLILVFYGAMTGSDAEMYKRSLNTNINLLWGLVLFFVGAVMVVLARRAMKNTSN
jgi:protein-S-isoprenylcysteine O-methyltransferase Ste14